jgi:hypothetical protein
MSKVSFDKESSSTLRLELIEFDLNVSLFIGCSRDRIRFSFVTRPSCVHTLTDKPNPEPSTPTIESTQNTQNSQQRFSCGLFTSSLRIGSTTASLNRNHSFVADCFFMAGLLIKICCAHNIVIQIAHQRKERECLPLTCNDQQQHYQNNDAICF